MMKRKTASLSLVLVASLTLGLASCKKEGCTDPQATNFSEKAKKDDGSCVYPEVLTGNAVVEGNITSNTTWNASKIYELKGKVVVKSGYTLTIEAGTIIKAQEGSDVSATALIIERGAKINANGTAAKPIIFTSILDNIAIGQLAGTNLTETDAGKWGGLIVLGKAPISAADGDTQGQIEGIPATETYGTFGGSDATDNSGVLNYISIRFSGALIGAGNEINGLTLGGVGSGTTVSNIEIISNLDDGIEIFGGSVNVTNVLVAFQQDDAIDVDMSWSGTLDNFYTINNTGTGSDEGLEIDGPEGTSNTGGLFTIKNGTCVIAGGGNASGDFKAKAQGTVNNVSFGKAKIRASYQNNCADVKSDALSYLISATPKLIFTGSSFTSHEVYTASLADDGVTACSVQQSDMDAAATKMTSATGITGGNKTVFNTWTWTSIKGKL